MNSGSSAPIHATVQVERCFFISSSSHRSRPACIGTSWSVRRATRTVSTRSMPSIARSVMALSGIRRPPRRPSFAVITTLQPASTIRSRSDSALNPPKTTECTAPIRAHASIAYTVSGIIGM